MAATVVYDNSATSSDLHRDLPAVNGNEYGDEITLAAGPRQVSQFEFEYFLSGNASGDEKAQVVFHAMDGPMITRTLPDGSSIQVQAPGSVLFTSPVLSLNIGFNTGVATGLNITAPDNFTWSVTFTGIDAGETAGLRMYDPVAVGSSFSDFWLKSGGTWSLDVVTDSITGATVPANFGARVSAVPEPTTMALALLAGLGLLGYRRLQGRS
jgi:hypothetical protein